MFVLDASAVLAALFDDKGLPSERPILTADLDWARLGLGLEIRPSR